MILSRTLISRAIFDKTFYKAILRSKFMPHPLHKIAWVRILGIWRDLALPLERCASGCMWLLAEGMQSLERGRRDGTKKEECGLVAWLAD